MRLPRPLPTAAALVTATLGACALNYGPRASLQPGATVDEAQRMLGTPTGRHAVPGGERIEYARGPFGRHTYMLDFDASGRLRSWQQVLDEAHFGAVRAGMTRDDVLASLGRPSEIRTLAWPKQTLWAYRYETPFCSWFQVSLDARGTVADTGYGPDPRCNAHPK